MEGADRDRVVTEFRDGVTKILISTDVLSRGFDVSQVRREGGQRGTERGAEERGGHMGPSGVRIL